MNGTIERIELVTTVMLGIATAASAWSTYQAQLWNSRQLADMSQSSRLQGASLRATDIATRDAVVDVTTFATVVAAENAGNRGLARYLAGVARPAFRAPLQAWVDRREAGGISPPRPFDDPSYRDSVQRPAIDLQARADAAFDRASAAQQKGDQFVMRTVVFALALFFLGVSGQLRARGARWLAATFGVLIVVLGLVSLTRLERAPRPNWDQRAGASSVMAPAP